MKDLVSMRDVWPTDLGRICDCGQQVSFAEFTYDVDITGEAGIEEGYSWVSLRYPDRVCDAEAPKQTAE